MTAPHGPRLQESQGAAAVLDLDLARTADELADLPGDPAAGGPATAWLVVRLFTEPLGLVRVAVPPGGLTPERAVAAAVTACRPALLERLRPLGLPEHTAMADLGLRALPAERSPFLARRREVLAEAPHVAVVVCTRDRAASLGRCLDSLAGQEYPRFDVLVVDSAPSDGSARDAVRARAGALAVRYSCEPRPGLSRARNHALDLLCGGSAGTGPAPDLLAWIDDDGLADRHWLAELARAFADVPRAAAASGVVVPAELHSRAQVWFEEFAGHSRGRGFASREFSPATAREQSPLYPLPPFGVGANMAFRPSALLALRGFDEALGAGTPAQGGEDTLAFTRLLRAGHTTVYQASALTRHVHRTDVEGLRAQLRSYGRGLTAFYAALVLADPRAALPLVRLAPRALRDLTGSDGARAGGLGADFPVELLRESRAGMLEGPRLYLRGRRAVRRELRRGRLATPVPG